MFIIKADVTPLLLVFFPVAFGQTLRVTTVFFSLIFHVFSKIFSVSTFAAYICMS